MNLKIFVLVLGVVFVSLSGNPAVAGEKPGNCKGKDCHRLLPVCFNVYCVYDKNGDDDFSKTNGYQRCEAAAVFTKLVTDTGDEVEDSSDVPYNPDFEVECDGRRIFNNSGHRYTDWTGTRIQALTGPFPAIMLPRGALRDGHGYVGSTLELVDQRLAGYCYVYTGPQFEGLR